MTRAPAGDPTLLDLADVDPDRVDLVGGKAAGLAVMVELGLRVPPGFVLTTVAWRASRPDRSLSSELGDEVDAAIARLEEHIGRGLGDGRRPLLVSVRSGAPMSMPGMMDTVLDLGITSTSRAGLAAELGDAISDDCEHRFARSYRRVVGTTAPDDAREQLLSAVAAVFASWDSPRARAYRDLHGVEHDAGTAVVVQAMVLGNRGPTSGSGIVCSRDPDFGHPGLTGDYLPDAQGDDVADGTTVPLPISALADRSPELAVELAGGVASIERRLRDLVDVEFTIEDGVLHYLQCRVARRAAPAAVRIAVDLVDEGSIDVDEAVARVTPAQLDAASRPRIDTVAAGEPVAVGIGACPGVATGRVCLSADRVDALGADGAPVVLVRPETSPDDLPGMILAAGLLTSRGGLVSHAALIARELDLPAVVGVEALVVDEATGRGRLGDVQLPEGSTVTIDGATGAVHVGVAPVTDPDDDERLARLRRWRDAP